MAVAGAGFGRFAGQLVAPDENGGVIRAFAAAGRRACSPPRGCPRAATSAWRAWASCRGASGRAGRRCSPTASRPAPRTRAATPCSPSAAGRCGARACAAGDLLAVTEAGALTIAIRCARRCSVRRVAEGPAITHAEGHIAFVPPR